ncbi:MAG: MFS transporter, partial [Armatimonadota bacterium]|nr:MFS transporter [Armatimonadota bacterium]
MMCTANMAHRDTENRKWLVLGVVAVGNFMSTLDASIVSVALPTLTRSFRTDLAVSQWFVLAYTTTVTILLLV